MAELVTGCIFVIIGLFSLAQGLTEPQTAGRLIASIANMLAIASGPWVARPILRKLKENVTYPRSGYVSYQKPSKSSRNLSWVLAGLVAVVITWVLIRTQQVTMAWIPLIEGLAVGGFIFYQAHLNGLLRYYLLATFAFILRRGNFDRATRRHHRHGNFLRSYGPGLVGFRRRHIGPLSTK